ncbi:hypothetical protein, partial [Capnocytophaga granulosa]|uniref:hypothetical protein n=1 Tax=Capnocytophaga granulosa TaxID=45242 RepID=UPI003605BF61
VTQRLRKFISIIILIINTLNKNTLIFYPQNKALVTQRLRKLAAKNLQFKIISNSNLKIF